MSSAEADILRSRQLRARRACDFCKTRKTRCIQIAAGGCQRCKRDGRRCVIESAAGEGAQHDDERPQYPVDSDSFMGSEGMSVDTPYHPPTSSRALGAIPDLVAQIMPEHSGLYGAAKDSRGGSVSLESAAQSAEARHTTETSGVLDSHALNDAIKTLPPLNVARYLLTTCFKYCADSYYYGSQHDMQLKVDDFYANSKSRLRSDPCFVCILLILLALGANWAHFTALSVPSEPLNALSNPASVFSRRARGLIPNILANPSQDAALAFFLIGVYLLTSDTPDLSYYHLGLAMKVAITEGMHNRHPRYQDIEIRSRLWWSIYTLERFVSIKLGHPESINARDISTPLPGFTSALDSNPDTVNIYHQVANSQLARSWSRIANSLPTVFSGDNSDWQRVDQLADMLRDWELGLPPELQRRNLDPKRRTFRADVHLHQNYSQAWVMLYREPLLSMVRRHLQRTYLYSEDAVFRDPLAANAAGMCYGAAKDMLSLFDILLKSHNLAPFSWVDFQGCSVATLVILIYGILERDEDYGPSLECGLRSLDYMAAHTEPAKIALRFIHGFQQVADQAERRAREKEGQTGSTTRDGEKTSPQAEYENWLSGCAASTDGGGGGGGAPRGASNNTPGDASSSSGAGGGGENVPRAATGGSPADNNMRNTTEESGEDFMNRQTTDEEFAEGQWQSMTPDLLDIFTHGGNVLELSGMDSFSSHFMRTASREM